MEKGQFFEWFFEQNGGLGEPNSQGEHAVFCPFEHDKGYEQNPSAHVNIKMGVFHCKTCLAEGRNGNGGLAEENFVSAYYKVSRTESVKFLSRFLGDSIEDESWANFQDMLIKHSPKSMEVLKVKRGFTDETILEYELGFNGSGIVYPVKLFGNLYDIRTYDPEGKPKMKSEKHRTTAIFPFDHWVADDRDTLLVGGENDALIGRQLGFNAVTFTGGEGSVPADTFLRFFKGRRVYVCYDMDLAGRKGGQRVAYKLREAGADVYMVSLPLTGEKDDKDLTDFVVTHNKGYADLDEIIRTSPEFSQEEFTQEKNRYYPLINLWEATNGEYYGRRISSRVIMAGKYDQVMYLPTIVDFHCKCGDDECKVCQGREGENTLTWTLEEDNLQDAMRLLEVDDQEQRVALYYMNYIKLSGDAKMRIRARESVFKYMFMPDVETESDSTNYVPVEQYSYVIGHTMNEGDKYRIFFKPYAHPNKGQKAFLVVDRVEDSDNAVNSFTMNEQVKQKLSVFKGHPDKVMKERFEMAKGITKGYTVDRIVWAIDLVYHSPLKIKLMGKTIKGYPEAAVIGETGTGKTSTAEALQHYYGIGNRTVMKSATEAGLIGGADRTSTGGLYIKWGTLPRNNKGLVILEEMSGAKQEIINKMTDIRSEGVANITRMGGTFRAMAQTRLIWFGNPRVVNKRSVPFSEYPTGVDAVLDLVGANEDVRRFDLVLLEAANDKIVRDDEFSKDSHPHNRDTYASLIRWVWSRTPDQVIFDESVSQYLMERSTVLNEKFNSDVSFLGVDARFKLARLAVACAACCFSTDDTGEVLLVEKEHVDWVERFLTDCYGGDSFRLHEYAAEQRRFNTVNPEIEAVVHGLMRTDASALMIRELTRSTEHIPKGNLMDLSGLDRDQFAKALTYMNRHHLILSHAKGIRATRRLRIAAKTFVDTRLKSITER